MAVSSSKRILFVEDNEILSRTLKNFIEKNSEFVFDVEDREDTAVSRIIEEQPDLVILDIGLPGMDGLEVCKRVRERDYSGLIIVFTGRIKVNDQHVCFEAGANDFVHKPIDYINILARVEALFSSDDQKGGKREERAGEEDDPDRIEVGDLCIDRKARSVTKGDEPVDLTTSEFDLLWILASRAGEVVTREELFMSLRECKWNGIQRGVDKLVSRLRKKLGDDGRSQDLIKSCWGEGYLLLKVR